jgi:hypothetical protein
MISSFYIELLSEGSGAARGTRRLLHRLLVAAKTGERRTLGCDWWDRIWSEVGERCGRVHDVAASRREHGDQPPITCTH